MGVSGSEEARDGIRGKSSMEAGEGDSQRQEESPAEGMFDGKTVDGMRGSGMGVSGSEEARDGLRGKDSMEAGEGDSRGQEESPAEGKPCGEASVRPAREGGMDRRTLHKKILTEFLIAFLWLLAIIFLLPRAIGFFLPFVIGWLIALIANPFVQLLERKVRLQRKHSTAIITVGILAVVVLALYFAVTVTARQLHSLLLDLPSLFDGVQRQVNLALQSLQGVAEILPADVQASFNDIGNTLMSTIAGFLRRLSASSFGSASSLVRNVAEFFFMAIITILSAYFFIGEREQILGGIRRAFPPAMLERANLIKDNFTKALGGYFKAQFKIMGIIVVILSVGFWLLRVKYAIFLAAAVALLDFLPFFGTGTVLFPWALIEFLGRDFFKGACLVALYFVCQVARQILQPKMVGDSIGLSPLTTLLFMFVGYRIKGVFGMIVGIPLGMAVISLYRAGAFDTLIRGAQILIQDISEYKKF